MGDEREKIGVAIPREAFEAFGSWCKEQGRIKQDMLGRVLTWFVASKDKVLWAAILNDIDPRVAPAYADALRRMADRLDQKAADPLGPGVVIPRDADPLPRKKREQANNHA